MTDPLDIALYVAAGGVVLTVLLLLGFGARRTLSGLMVSRLERRIAHADAILTKAMEENFGTMDRLLFQLGEIRDQRAVEAALEKLLDKNDSRLEVPLSQLFRSLGLIDRYLEQVRKASKWTERAGAARALGKLGVVDAVPLLVAVMRDPQEDARSVKQAAARALGELRAPEAIPLLMKELETRDEWASPRLADILVSFGETAVPQLLESLVDEAHANSRAWAAQVLGKIGSQRAVAPLLQRLHDRSEQVRMAVAEALGALGDRRATNELVQIALRDPVGTVRAEAARALGQMRDESVLETLVTLLADPDYWTRLRTIEAIELLKPEDPTALDSALRDPSPEVRKRAAVALQRIGVLDQRVEELAGNDRGIVDRAMRTLIEMGRAGLIESILAHLEHPSLRVRSRITEVLGRVGDQYAVPALLPLLGDIEWPVRVRAVEAVGQLALGSGPGEGAYDGVQLLVPLLSDPEENVRSAAVAAIRSLGLGENPEGLAAVLRLYDTDNAEVRASVLETVGSLALPEVDDLLHRALLDPNHEVRLRAIRSVEQRPSPDWEAELVDQLGDPEFGGRPDAVRVLGRIGTPEAIEAVIKNLDTPDRKLREALTDVLAAKGVDHLLEKVGSTDREEVELAMIWALGKTGEPSAIVHVVNRAEHPSADVRAAVCGALAKLGGETSLSILERLARDRSERVRAAASNALGSLGIDAAVPALAAATRDPDRFVRNRALLALGRTGTRRAREALAVLPEGPLEDDAHLYLLIARVLAQVPSALEAAIGALTTRGVERRIKRILSDESEELGARFRQLLRIETRDIEVETLALEYVETLQNSQSADERASAVRALAVLDVHRYQERLFDTIRTDPDDGVRRLAVMAFSEVEIDGELEHILIDTLRDPSVTVQIEAARGLTRLASPTHNDRLLRTFLTRDPELAEVVTEALVEANSGRTADFIDQLMGYSDLPIQVGAAGVLGRLAEPAAARLLTAWCRSREPSLRAGAVEALGRIGTGAARTEIALCAEDPSELVRTSVVRALGRRADGALRERLLQMAHDPSLEVRRQLADSVKDRETELAVVLAERLADDPEQDIRARALRSLAAADDASALVRFVEMAKAAPVDVQALLQSTPADHAATVAAVSALLERRLPAERMTALEAIQVLGALTPERLESSFADPSPDVRVRAVELATDASGEALERLLRDPDQRVRDAARRHRLQVVAD